jgi:hypothetical protein
VVIVVFALNGGRTGVIQAVPAFAEVEQIVDDWKGGPGVDVVDVALDVDDGEAAVRVVLATDGEPPAVEALAGSLADALARPVDVEVQVVVARTARATADGES